MPEVVSPCQLDLVRFAPVQARRLFRVTGSAYGSSPLFRFVQEEALPVGSYKSEAFEAVSSAPAAASAVRLVLKDGFPCAGARFEIVGRRAGSALAKVVGR